MKIARFEMKNAQFRSVYVLKRARWIWHLPADVLNSENSKIFRERLSRIDVLHILGISDIM